MNSLLNSKPSIKITNGDYFNRLLSYDGLS